MSIIDRLRTRTDAKEIIEAIDELSESFVTVANGLHEEQKG